VNQDMKPSSPPAAAVGRPSAVFLIAVVALAVAGGPFSLVLGTGLVMGSDSCVGVDSRLICSAAGQNLVFALPLFAWLAATVISLFGGFVVARRRELHPNSECSHSSLCDDEQVWLVRHGESSSNAGLVTSDPAEIPLTVRGREQAEQVAKQVERALDLIVSRHPAVTIQGCSSSIHTTPRHRRT